MIPNELNLHQELHDLQPRMSDAKLRAAAKNAAAAMKALPPPTASGSSSSASSLPIGLVEAAMRSHPNLSRAEVEAELIAFGA